MKKQIKAQNTGGFSKELQDYLIIENEKKTEKNYERILKMISEIKEYIFNTQDNQIKQLERRIQTLENYVNEKKEEERSRNEKFTQIRTTTFISVITQSISILTSIITVIVLIRLGLR